MAITLPPCDSYGDVDDDGYVTQADADLIRLYVFGGWAAVRDTVSISESEFVHRADVDGNGYVNMGDVGMVFSYIGGTINTFPVCTVTCDSNPYASMGVDTGCELLLHYGDNDGLISLDALTQSYSDYENGVITEEEFDFVSDAYINGGINVVCPGCWEAPPKKTVTFGSVPAGAEVAID